MDITTLEELLSRPSAGLLEEGKSWQGDLLILGVGGKMGPTLAMMARRALPARCRVIGVSLFSDENTPRRLQEQGVETIAGDLLDEAFLAGLPEAPSVMYMAGLKFGSTGNPAFTWAMNTLLPAMVARRYPKSRIAAFSTGNIYPFVDITGGGCKEDQAPAPLGEYAQSCLGRERMLQYFSIKNSTPMVLLRLNYATELRYGVIVDVATKVLHQEPIDLTMGHFNLIWQGDANNMALRALAHAKSPAEILNITGPGVISIRNLASQFGEIFGKPPIFTGQESGNALLNNPGRALALFGQPGVSLPQMIEWVAAWLQANKPLLNKPTHFEQRNGQY